jgi:hypothetical protein
LYDLLARRNIVVRRACRRSSRRHSQARARVCALTKPGGWCLIEFGNRASFTARFLAPAWHEYAPQTRRRRRKKAPRGVP